MRIKSSLILSAVTICLVIGSAAVADELGHDDAQAAEVLMRLRKAYPATRFDAVRPAEIPGIYEVAMGRNLAYVEPGGRYFLFGHLYDLPANDDITARRAAYLQAVKPGSLPEADGFVIRRSEHPKYRLSVFSDPQCGYCRALEKQLSSMPEIEVTVYLLPLQDGSEDRSADVWCAKDRAQAWKSMLLSDGGVGTKSIQKVGCDTSVFARNRALASQLGIHGTPALIAADGRMQPGAMNRTELLAWLSGSSTIKEAVAP